MKFLSSFEKNIKFTPAIIAVSYAVISALWVVLTDYFLASYITDPAILTQYQTVKGWFFIVSTAMLLYYFIRSSFKTIEDTTNALRNSENKYRTLLEQASDGILLADEFGNLIDANSEACSILGYERSELLRLNLKDIVDKEDLARNPFGYKDLYSGATVQTERILCRKDGQKLTADISSRMIYHNNIQAIFRDITEKKRAEEELRTSEQQYRVLFKKNPHPMWVYEMDTLSFLAVNGAAVESYGYSNDEFMKMTIKDIRPEEDVPLLVEQAYSITDDYQRSGPWRHKKKDGSVIFTEIISSSIIFAGRNARMVIALDITESHNSMLALKESERRYRSLFEQTPISILEEDFSIIKTHIDIVKTTGVENFREYLEKYPEEILNSIHMVKVLDVNQTAIELFEGEDKEEIINSLSGIAEEATYQAQKESIIAISEGKTRFEIETVTQTLKGKRLSILYRWAVAEGYEKNYAKVMVTIADISERKRAEEALKAVNRNLLYDITERRRAEKELMESEAKFRELADSISDLFFAADKDLRVIYWNKASESVTGIPASNAVGKNILDIFPQIKGSRLEEELAVSLSSQETRSIVRNLQVNGFSRIYEISIYPFLSGLSVFGKDITDRQTIEQELDTSRERFSSFMQNLPGIAFIKDLSGRYIFANRTWEDQSGRKLNGSSSVCDSDIWDEDTAAEFMRNDKQVISGGQGIYTIEVCPQQDGVHHWLMSKFPLKDVKGSYSAIGAIGIDITDKIKAEEEIRKLNYELSEKFGQSTSQLEDARRELQAFAFAVSHDLMTPLRAIDGFSQILLDEYAAKLDNEAKRYLHTISRNAGQMEQLIDDLTTFSKLQLNEPVVKRVNMNDLADSVIQDLLRGENEENIKFKVNPLPECCGDKTMIQQVWSNLISNAIKFTGQKENALIEISGSRENDNVVYSISDNGIGFSNEYAHRLFEIFYKLHPAGHFEGTGVGLAIVKRIINKHGGSVWAKGTPQKGAIFYFTLPAIKK